MVDWIAGGNALSPSRSLNEPILQRNPNFHPRNELLLLRICFIFFINHKFTLYQNKCFIETNVKECHLTINQNWIRSKFNYSNVSQIIYNFLYSIRKSCEHKNRCGRKCHIWFGLACVIRITLSRLNECVRWFHVNDLKSRRSKKKNVSWLLRLL